MTGGVVGVAVAGAMGALSRHGVGRLLAPVSGAFPWGTLTINVVGCAAIAAAGLAAAHWSAGAGWLHTDVMTGFIGAFTTFSTFQVETLLLAESDLRRAALYMGGSTAAGLAAIWLVTALGGPH